MSKISHLSSNFSKFSRLATGRESNLPWHHHWRVSNAQRHPGQPSRRQHGQEPLPADFRGCTPWIRDINHFPIIIRTEPEIQQGILNTTDVPTVTFERCGSWASRIYPSKDAKLLIFWLVQNRHLPEFCQNLHFPEFTTVLYWERDIGRGELAMRTADLCCEKSSKLWEFKSNFNKAMIKADYIWGKIVHSCRVWRGRVSGTLSRLVTYA